MIRRFDAIVIGAGQAGSPLAVRLARAGMEVAIIERHLVGGTCVNTGCMPTKTLVASAYAAHLARRAADYGVVIGGPVGVDMQKVRARALAVAHNAHDNVVKWLEGAERVTLIHGHARFTGPDSIEVNGETLTAGKVFINVGGRATVPDMPGVRDIATMTNRTILELGELPRHLAVIGGSYIGLEYAQMYRRFGAQVTVIEKGPRIVGREDERVSADIQKMLEAEGVAFRLDAECIGFAPHDDGALVHVDCNSGDRAVVASHVLLAVGRRPNTEDLGLDAAGVATDARGNIIVDDELRTNVPGIWAMGDCNGRGAFTHTSYNDFEIIAENLLDGASRRLSDRISCYALFTDPPLARIGLSRDEALKQGRRIKVGERPMTRVGRAVEKGESQGFMQIVVDAESDAILGATILGIGGDEAIHCILDLMYAGAPADRLRRSVHIHPTVAELLPTIAGELKPAG